MFKIIFETKHNIREVVLRSWKRARQWSPKSEVKIIVPTDVSLECGLSELMTDEKYQIIHMFHMGSVL
jgi:hypothetical protein